MHSQSDAGMMRAVGMPEWLIAHDQFEFEKAALRLIENDAERTSIARKLRDIDVEMVFSDREGNEYSTDFTNAVWFAYTKHESIQQSGKRYWTVAERRQFRDDKVAAGDAGGEH